MKSYTNTSLGSPSRALTFHPSVPTPSVPSNPKSTLLLLKLSHAALNPADLALQRFLPPWLPFRSSPVPGLDFAGEVVAVGGGVGDDVKVGDRVCGAVGLKGVAAGRGALAEWIVVERAEVTKVPVREGWNGREVVGVTGIAGQTAAEMVRCVGEEGVKGRRVLVNGASGGVGSLVVQVLRGLRAEVVVGVCSAASEGLVKRLGAGEVVDYKADRALEERLRERFGEQPFDAILDCVGSQTLFSKSPGYLKPDGKFITIVGGWSQGVIPFVKNKMRPTFLGGTPRSYHLFLLSASGERAKEVADWVEQGVIKESLVDSEYPLEKAVEVCCHLHLCGSGVLNADLVRHMRSWRPAEPRARLSSRLEATDHMGACVSGAGLGIPHVIESGSGLDIVITGRYLFITRVSSISVVVF